MAVIPFSFCMTPSLLLSDKGIEPQILVFGGNIKIRLFISVLSGTSFPEESGLGKDNCRTTVSSISKIIKEKIAKCKL